MYIIAVSKNCWSAGQIFFENNLHNEDNHSFGNITGLLEIFKILDDNDALNGFRSTLTQNKNLQNAILSSQLREWTKTYNLVNLYIKSKNIPSQIKNNNNNL